MPQEFQTSQLAALGLPASTVKGWIDRGFVKPRSLGPGPNQGPRWTFAEVMQLVGASRLSALGVPLADAIRALEGAALLRTGYIALFSTTKRDFLAARTMPNDESLVKLLRRPSTAAVAVLSVPELQARVVEGLGLRSYPQEIETGSPVIVRHERELDAPGVFARRRAGVAAAQAELAEIRARGDSDEGR